MRRREFITLLGGAAARGRSRRGRSSRDAGRRLRQRLGRPRFRAPCCCVPQGPQRGRLHRGPERDGRVPLAGRPIRSLAVAHGRSCPPPRGRDCDDRRRPLRLRPKPRPRRSRSSSGSPKTRSSSVWSRAWPGRAAMRPASIFSTRKSWPSGWVSCTTSCPRPFGLPCWSIRPMLRTPRPRYATYRKLPAPSDCKFRSSKPAPAARSRRPSLAL